MHEKTKVGVGLAQSVGGAVPVNKLLIVGHPLSGYEKILDILMQTGMASAKPSKREGMDAVEIGKILLKSSGNDGSVRVMAHTEIAAVWNGLALDLMLGNLDEKMWCWADPDAISLLEYWKAVDNRLGFVLTYSSPEDFIVDSFRGVEKIDDDMLEGKLREWYEYNKALMGFYLRNRDRSYLVHSANVVRNTQEYIRDVGSMMALSLSVENVHASKEVPTAERAAYRYISAQMLCHFPEVVALYDELQSVASQAFDVDPRFAWDAKGAWSSLVELENKIVSCQEKEAYLAKKIEQDSQQVAKLQEELSVARSGQKVDVALAEENELLLTQLHATQEELERYYLENEALKKQQVKKPQPVRLYGAADRIKQQLSYRLGAEIISRSRSPWGWLMMPFALLGVHRRYRQDRLANAGKKLPRIAEYADAHEAEKVKKHLSYRLGAALLDAVRTPLGVLTLPFALVRVAKAFKAEKK